MFEGVFLTEEQVQRYEEMYHSKGKSSNPPFLSWKVVKVAYLQTEEDAVEAVPASHTPWNIEKRKTRSGRKVPSTQYLRSGRTYWTPLRLLAKSIKVQSYHKGNSWAGENTLEKVNVTIIMACFLF